MQYKIRPLGTWLRPITEHRKPGHAFTASWPDTLALLGSETGKLGADLVVLQLGVTEGEVRRDGMLKATATVRFPGVLVSFQSIHGPLTYAGDRYDTWKANVRAIALGLQALRAVDRYGIGASGEHYRGFSAIAATSGEFDMTTQDAARFLAEDTDFTPDQVRDPIIAQRAYRAASLKHHPDRGGDPETFRRITNAKNILTKEG